MLVQFKEYLLVLSLGLFFLILLYGGLGVEREMLEFVGLVISVILILATRLYRRKIEFPRGFGIYLVLIIFLILNYFASLNPTQTLEYVYIFIAGGFYWLSFYNATKKIKENFYFVPVSLGLVFGFLYFLNYFKNFPITNSFSLFSSNVALHNHIGDLWAVILVVIFTNESKLIKSKKLLLLSGAFFVVISGSRSAYLSILAGLGFYFWKKGGFSKLKRFWIYIIGSSVIVTFIFLGFQKSLLSARFYYFTESVKAVLVAPEGVGMGNFGLVAQKEMQVREGDKEFFSSVTHNIVLEFMVGMGLWGSVFIIWLLDIGNELLDSKFVSNLTYQAAFVAVFINFMLDYTYIITTMIWLWFCFLGIAHAKKYD